jgi:hypothetical protein
MINNEQALAIRLHFAGCLIINCQTGSIFLHKTPHDQPPNVGEEDLESNGISLNYDFD